MTPDSRFAATVDQNLAVHRELVEAIAEGSEERASAAAHAHQNVLSSRGQRGRRLLALTN